jgi:hypothetical protein
MLENTEGVIKKDNPEKLATLGAKEEDKRRNHNTICVGHYYAQADTHYVSKTCALLQTTGGKDELRIVFICRNRNGHDSKVATCK